MDLHASGAHLRSYLGDFFGFNSWEIFRVPRWAGIFCIKAVRGGGLYLH